MKSQMKRAIVLGLGILTFGMGSADAADRLPNMKEGKWEVTISMDIPGMPMQMPPVVAMQCISKEEPFPDDTTADQNTDCEPVKMKINGDTVNWSVKCNTEGGPMTGEGKITYKGNTFDGEVKMNQGGMTITNKMKGKYIGPCQ